jgi:hypothetical protein
LCGLCSHEQVHDTGRERIMQPRTPHRGFN